MNKYRVCTFGRDGQLQCSISLNGEKIVVVNELRYLGLIINKDGKVEVKGTGRRTRGVLRGLVNGKNLF